ncbi:hypothetical protein GMOD_00009990 [Pyrenophora seminiperda CCB06]|uniref:Uncharacterized protein n=1 Tax=Pyrenophora seminiperda CCB06 TaxID=1302712 RepID=A0A3M7M1J1_9PLEO|nr:hypothetical protein GMOD_00009990 [Pyrenophora seminiperda CCB06]
MWSPAKEAYTHHPAPVPIPVAVVASLSLLLRYDSEVLRCILLYLHSSTSPSVVPQRRRILTPHPQLLSQLLLLLWDDSKVLLNSNPTIIP